MKFHVIYATPENRTIGQTFTSASLNAAKKRTSKQAQSQGWTVAYLTDLTDYSNAPLKVLRLGQDWN